MKPYPRSDLRNRPFLYTIITAAIFSPILSCTIGQYVFHFFVISQGQTQGIIARFLGFGLVTGIVLGILIAYLLRHHPTPAMRWIMVSTLTGALIMGGLGWCIVIVLWAIATPIAY